MGTGRRRDLSAAALDAVRAADVRAAWVNPPADLLDGDLTRLPASPDVDAWESRLEGLTGRLVYLAPGYGPDDDPAVPALEAASRRLDLSAERIGESGPELNGTTVVGPASRSWRPDPARTTLVRGIVDAGALDEWAGRLEAAYGTPASLRLRAWSDAAWGPLDQPPAERSYPVMLRAEPIPDTETRSTDYLLDLMERLLGPEGCPWDREQTHRSLRRYLIEETHEVLAAIESEDAGALADELGDLLLQIAFHAEIARRGGDFGWPDVVAAISEKLVRRHPHVFGDLHARDARDVKAIWDSIKLQERDGSDDPLDSIPATLPPLMYARKLAGHADRLGIDLGTADGAATALSAALDDLGDRLDAGAVGDAILEIASRAAAIGVDPEMAVRDATARLRARIEAASHPR